MISFFENQKISENKNELKLILHTLVKIANNHNRSNNLIEKINQIISYLSIEKYFSNREIFDIFSKNKLILLFLFKNDLLKPTSQIGRYNFTQ